MDKLSAEDEAVKWLNKPDNNFCAMPFVHMRQYSKNSFSGNAIQSPGKL